MEELFNDIEVKEQAPQKTFKKLALPEVYTKEVNGVEKRFIKGVVGTFVSSTFNDEGDYGTLTFDVDGVEMRKNISSPFRWYNKEKAEGTLKPDTLEKAKKKAQALNEDFGNIARNLGSELIVGKVNTFKDLFNANFANAKPGSRVLSKVLYKDKVSHVEYDKAQGIDEAELKARYTPFVAITSNDLYWCKWEKAKTDFPISEGYDVVDYEINIKEPVEPSGADDLPFGNPTELVAEEDLF